MTSEQALDLLAEVGELRDEVTAALAMIKLQTGAILELREKLTVQGKLLVLVSQRARGAGPP